MNVIVTFLEEDFAEYETILTEQTGLDLNKFSFQKSIEATKDITCSFAEALIEERRSV